MFIIFADGGNGDLFGYSVLNGMVQRDDIYVWNHENDSRTWVAPSLKLSWSGGEWEDNNLNREKRLVIKETRRFFVYCYCNRCICIIDRKILKIKNY